MIGESLYMRIRKFGFLKKSLTSILVFVIFGVLIYSLSAYFDSGYPFFLIFLPLILTSGFYFKRWNLFPSSLATLFLLILSVFHYGQQFFDRIYVSVLNLAIFSVLFSIVSILIGHVSVSFRKLRNEKKNIAAAKEEVKERKNFLNTLLRQDLESKNRTIQGYLQLLQGIDLPEESGERLKKAMKAGREAGEILRLAKELSEIESTEWRTEKDICKVLEHAIEDVSELAKERDVKIEEDCPEDIGKAEGDHSMNTLFSQILKTRIQTSGCDVIRVSGEDRNGEMVLKFEDNGRRLSEDVKNLFSGASYTGDTSGSGGVRYYMLREIAEHNNAEIRVKNSELGGARFDVHLQRC